MRLAKPKAISPWSSQSCCGQRLHHNSPAGNILHHFDNLGSLEGLRDYPINLRSLSLVRTDRFAPPRDNGHWDLAIALTQGARQFPAVHIRHADIGEDRVKIPAGEK